MPPKLWAYGDADKRNGRPFLFGCQGGFLPELPVHPENIERTLSARRRLLPPGQLNR
jgi:hypothetical protein